MATKRKKPDEHQPRTQFMATLTEASKLGVKARAQNHQTDKVLGIKPPARKRTKVARYDGGAPTAAVMPTPAVNSIFNFGKVSDGAEEQ